MANSISGNAGLAGALVVLSGAAEATATADGSGNYTFSGLSAGIYYVLCDAASQTFTPQFSKQTVVASNITGVNFTASVSPAPAMVWANQGVVLPPNTTQLNGGSPISGVLEGSYMYEGNAQILSGNVFKAWFTGGAAAAPGKNSINYAESSDGLTWTQYSGNPIVANHNAGRVFKHSNIYYGYWLNSNTPDGGTSFDQYTSSDGVNWTLAHASVLTAGEEYEDIWDMQVVQVDSNGLWWAVYGGRTGSHSLNFTSLATSPDGVIWTKYSGNPILVNLTSLGKVYNVNGIWYAWGDFTVFNLGGALPNQIPCTFGRSSSVDLMNWTAPVLSMQTTQPWESGLGGGNWQMDSPGLVEVNGKTYMFYSGSATGEVGTGWQIGLATADMPISELVKLPIEGQISPALVQSNLTTFVTATTYSAAYKFPNIAGNTLIAISYNNSAPAIPTVTDTNNNTWVKIDSSLTGFNAANMVACFVCLNCVGGANTVTWHTNTSSNNGDLAILEYSGVRALDQHGIALGSSTTPTSASVATTATNETLLGYIATSMGSVLSSGGYLLRKTDPTFLLVEDKEQGVISAVNATATSLSGPWAAGILTLAPSLHLISGNSGIAGATVTLSGDASKSTTADSNGNYSFASLLNGSYVVTPSLIGYTFLPTSMSFSINNANVLGINFMASLGAAVYSVPDCRVAPFGPNTSRTVQGTVTYDVQTSDNAAVPGVDSRAAGAPLDCRISPNIPQNSRAPGTFGPGE